MNHPDHKIHIKQASSICRAWKCLRRIIQNYFRTSLKTLHPLSAVSLGVGLSVVPPVHAVHPEKLNLVSLSAFVHWFRESFPIVSGSKQIVSPLELIRSLWIMKRPQKSSFSYFDWKLATSLRWKFWNGTPAVLSSACFNVCDRTLPLWLSSFFIFRGFTFYWP